MVNRAAIFETLTTAKTSAADDALLGALPDAEPALAQQITETLLTRRTHKALQGLVAHFHQLDETLRQRLLCEMDDLFPMLRPCAQAREERVRLNAIELIDRGKAYRAAYLLDAGLHDRSPAVREAAANALYSLAGELHRNKPVEFNHELMREMSPEVIESRMLDLDTYREDRRQLVSALDAGLNSYSIHLHPKIIEASMWYVDDLGSRLWSVISTPGSKAAHAASSILKGKLSPRLASFAFQAMSYSGLRNIVVKFMMRCTDPTFLAAWLRECWRLSQMRYARGMVAIKELDCVGNRAAVLMQLPPDSLRHAPHWISTTGLPDSIKTLLLKELSRCGHPRVERAAVTILAREASDMNATPLYALAMNSGSPLSGLARLHLGERDPDEYPISRLIERPGIPPHPEHVPARAPHGTGAAAEPESTLSFGQYWSRFDDMTTGQRIELGRAMAAGTSMLDALLARKFEDEDSHSRIRAIRMAAMLEKAECFTEQLHRLCHDPDSEVRSAAISAVGLLPDATSQFLVRKALSDSDNRVQANAVDAVGASGRQDVIETLTDKLASRDNRVRANAVKALLKLGVREAAETLLKMLTDGNRAQRISALWLVENMGLFTLATRVMVMAGTDEDENVRKRAEKLAADLIGQPEEVVPCT